MLVALLLLQRLRDAALVDLMRQSFVQGRMLALCDYLDRVAQVTSLWIWQGILLRCLTVECLLIKREGRLLVPQIINFLKLPHHTQLVIDSLSLTGASGARFQLLLLERLA